MKENLSDKKLLDNTTYKKLSILSDEMLTFKDIVDARKKELKRRMKREGKKDWEIDMEIKWASRWRSHKEQWSQCTFPRRGYPMEKDSKWRSKDDTGLKIYIKKGSRGFEKGTIMIKDPEKWYDWQIRALYIMYPDHKDVMLVLVKKHLADWGIPSSPLERSDMRNKEEAFINKLIRSSENEQSSCERMDSSISGGESKNQTDDEKPLLNTELKSLLWFQKTVDEDIVKLKQKLAKAEASSKQIKDKIKKKQKELKKEKRMEERRKRITELAAELERLKRLNEEEDDSSDEDEDSSCDEEDEDSSDEEDNSGHTIRIDSSDEAALTKEEEEEELDEIEFDEPDFPGEEEVEEFEHESLEQWVDTDFYKDDNNNVWDDNMEFVGTYDDDDNTISIKEDYEPEE